jgi:toxin ParE1/3/4
VKTCKFHPEAEIRIAEIWRFTFQQWGEEQADKYTLKIDDSVQRLCAGEIIGRNYNHIKKHDIKFISCQRHYIFYTEDRFNIFILTVLHDVMDLPIRLKDILE